MNQSNLIKNVDPGLFKVIDIPEYKIKIATSEEEKNKIFKLRYSVYIDELNEPLLTADHNYKRIKDEFDTTATHIGAFASDKAIGACSLKVVDQNFKDDMNIYEVERFDIKFSQSLVVFSRLLIERDFRSTGLFNALIQLVYASALLQDAKVGLACIPNTLTSLFSRLGFVSYKGSVLHPEIGYVTPMYLDLVNESFMDAIGSPFLNIYKSFKNTRVSEFLN